jgi:Fe-S-cluster-containing dehydrogenase component
LIDNERCIGCRFCMAACPYSTRSFNWGRPDNSRDGGVAYSPETGVPRRIGTVEKCDFCPEMARQGTLPGCVSSCDMAAIYFGDQNEDAVSNSEETVRLSRLLEERAAYRYLAELGTEPRVYYLPPRNRDFPGPSAPARPRQDARPAPDHRHAHPKATT